MWYAVGSAHHQSCSPASYGCERWEVTVQAKHWEQIPQLWQGLVQKWPCFVSEEFRRQPRKMWSFFKIVRTVQHWSVEGLLASGVEPFPHIVRHLGMLHCPLNASSPCHHLDNWNMSPHIFPCSLRRGQGKGEPRGGGGSACGCSVDCRQPLSHRTQTEVIRLVKSLRKSSLSDSSVQEEEVRPQGGSWLWPKPWGRVNPTLPAK